MNSESLPVPCGESKISQASSYLVQYPFIDNWIGTLLFYCTEQATQGTGRLFFVFLKQEF